MARVQYPIKCGKTIYISPFCKSNVSLLSLLSSAYYPCLGWSLRYILPLQFNFLFVFDSLDRHVNNSSISPSIIVLIIFFFFAFCYCSFYTSIGNDGQQIVTSTAVAAAVVAAAVAATATRLLTIIIVFYGFTISVYVYNRDRLSSTSTSHQHQHQGYLPSSPSAFSTGMIVIGQSSPQQ